MVRRAVGKGLLLGVVAYGALATVSAVSPPPAPGAPAMQAEAASPMPVVKQYCIRCHNDRLHTAELSLEGLDPTDVTAAAATWEKVVKRLRNRTMPPAGQPRPDGATYESAAVWLETALDKAVAANPNPGRVPALHRLNRTEYRNAVRDLLALEDINVESLLPNDDSSYGFDNIADALWISPTYLERYRSAAEKVSRAAVGDTELSASVRSYMMALDYTQDYQREDLPFGTRGGMRVDHHFPVDGEYIIRVKVPMNRGDNPDPGSNLYEPQEIELSIDGEPVEIITVHPPEPDVLDSDARSMGGGTLEADNALAARRTADETKLYEQAKSGEGPVSLRISNGEIPVRVNVKAGLRSIAATFPKRSSIEQETLREPYARRFRPEPRPELYLGGIDVVGPLNATGSGDTPNRRRVFVCYPKTAAEELPCARQILETVARRAFRRPVTPADMDYVLPFYEQGRANALTFDGGIEFALQRILMSPSFIFRVERDPAGIAPNTNYKITDLELASRLSFLLWSSIPDDELLAVAEKQQLHQPEVLTAQVRRMLADPKSEALTSNFAGQWLMLRRVGGVAPEQRIFPDFDDNLRHDFVRETELFFDSILRENRSVLELLTADYSFVNERLARHYGIPHVYGAHFRRVTFPEGSPRGGLLGQGSLLTSTSYGNRTSPVRRGKWILENVLGAPPPPPPPNVPALPDPAAGQRQMSMRERMEAHRANPSCAACHARMDPLGLALESFNAVGQYRTLAESGDPIDATGVMPDGITKFDGPGELRAALASHSAEFVMSLTERLFIYGLSRGLEYYDQPAIRQVIRDAAPEYRLSDLVVGLVTSQPFLMRRSPAADAEGSASAAQ